MRGKLSGIKPVRKTKDDPTTDYGIKNKEVSGVYRVKEVPELKPTSFFRQKGERRGENGSGVKSSVSP